MIYSGRNEIYFNVEEQMGPSIIPMNRQGNVAVLGGINLDISVRSSCAPGPGETVLGATKLEGLGGKGANQAVAAARAGARVSFLGLVGNDHAGSVLRSKLLAAGVDVVGLRTAPDADSGSAVIIVTDDGENRIVVIPGANEFIAPEFVEQHGSAIASSAVLVVQGEISPAASRAAIRSAASNGCRVVVNLAPVAVFGTEIEIADPLIVNEIEAAQLTGAESGNVAGIMSDHEKYDGLARSTVITLGSAGAVVIENGTATHVPAPGGIVARDTTGAGDALVGVVAARLAQGYGLLFAVADGVAAASSTVSTVGAAEAYPEFTSHTDVRHRHDRATMPK